MDTTSEFDVDTLPKDLKRLRACLRCHLIKNENQVSTLVANIC